MTGEVMNGVFWISLVAIIYAYIGYPLFLIIFTFFKRNEFVRDESYAPSVSLIIAAYNEEQIIRTKIEQSLALDYPKEKLEILIASDASSDKTDEIARGFSGQGVVLVTQQERRGKTAVQNLAAQQAKGEVLVFSDATTSYKKDALRKLVRNFSDKRIGIVGGKELFNNNKDSQVHKEVSLSWKYERKLRRLESRFNSLIGVSGCIFAIRKELYVNLSEDLIEDFALPLTVLEKGYKVHLETEAIGFEETVINAQDEFRRKVRIVSGGINVLINMRRLLNPFKRPKLAFQLVSHKILRWLAPLFFIGLFVSNAFLLKEGTLFKSLFLLQVGCYGLAILGYLMSRSKLKNKVVKVPFYFCLVNIAAIIGIYRTLFRENKVIWEPIR